MKDYAENVSLLIDLYELTMAQSYFINKPNTQATFELFVRNLAPARSYLVAAGLEDILIHVKNLRFNDAHIKYLRKQGLFSSRFLKYLKNFRFQGDIWAIPEGTVFFANQPLLRVTANVIEAQILESFCLNAINMQTMVASKASRVVTAAKGRGVFDFALRRAQGMDAAVKGARSSYIAGCRGSSNVLSGLIYGLPVVGTMAHSFIMAFDSEIKSFLAYSDCFPDNSTLLVDTYNTKAGIKNAVRVGRELKERGHRLLGVRLDSADLVSLSKMARKMLDRAGLNYVKIFGSGNLDEYKISDLIRKGAKIDNFGVGTNMGVSTDAPYLDVIYKLTEISDSEGKFLPTMKLSRHKLTYPGRKQVFRIRDKRGKYLRDVIGLEQERIKGEPLLVKVVARGKVIYIPPRLTQIRKKAQRNLACLPDKYKQVHAKYRYPVCISPRLKRLTESVSRKLEKRQRIDE